MAKELTEPTLYVHKRLRKLGGWRTCQEVRDDVCGREKGLRMLDLMGPFYMEHTNAFQRAAKQRERAVARITSRLVMLRRAGLAKHRIVITQNRNGTMKPVSQWKAIDGADTRKELTI